LLEHVAQLGSAQAQRDLGAFLYRGDDGWVRDIEGSRYWYREAAKRGHQEAQVAAGCMLLDGACGKVDREEGFRWLLEAARGASREVAWLGADALRNIYQTGQYGICPDSTQAAYWAEQARSLKRVPFRREQNRP
jgi:hypothetical protein